MRIIPLVTLSAALLFAAPATAQNSTQAGTAASTAAQATQIAETKAPAEEKKICKRLATSGTRMEERVCLTKDQWKKVEAEQ